MKGIDNSAYFKGFIHSTHILQLKDCRQLPVSISFTTQLLAGKLHQPVWKKGIDLLKEYLVFLRGGVSKPRPGVNLMQAGAKSLQVVGRIFI
jgi:hypothetical protein